LIENITYPDYLDVFNLLETKLPLLKKKVWYETSPVENAPRMDECSKLTRLISKCIVKRIPNCAQRAPHITRHYLSIKDSTREQEPFEM
ncbi:hypothetical protein PENTCL1PPCAC_19644, partial [Pristionchus entomophagus]